MLMNNGATIVAYLKNQGVSVSRVVQFGSGDRGLVGIACGDQRIEVHSREEEWHSGPVELSRSGVWSSSHRLVCYESKHEASITFFSNSRSHGMEVRSLLTSVGQS